MRQVDDMALGALFDDKRRGEIRLALKKGEPLPGPQKPATPAFAKALAQVEDISGILEGRGNPADAEIAQFRLDRDFIKAVSHGDALGAEAALARGAFVNARRFPLNGTRMVLDGDQEAFDRNVTKSQGDTALMIAVQNNDLAMVKLLISRSADINLRMNYGSYPTPTALVYAEQLGIGFESIASYLRVHGGTR